MNSSEATASRPTTDDGQNGGDGGHGGKVTVVGGMVTLHSSAAFCLVGGQGGKGGDAWGEAAVKHAGAGGNGGDGGSLTVHDGMVVLQSDVLPCLGYGIGGSGGVWESIVEGSLAWTDGRIGSRTTLEFADGRLLLAGENEKAARRCEAGQFDYDDEKYLNVHGQEAEIGLGDRLVFASFAKATAAKKGLVFVPTEEVGAVLTSVADTNEYAALFGFTVSGPTPEGKWFVQAALNDAGTNAVVKAQDEAKTNILAAVLAATTTGEDAAKLTIASPIKGFYYCRAQAEQLTGEGTAAQKLAGEGGADTVEFTLTKWTASGFYWLGISPDPLLKDEVEADRGVLIPLVDSPVKRKTDY